MMFSAWKRIRKRAKRGFRGYPVATVGFYGPDNKTATKAAVGLIPAEGVETSKMERWFSDGEIRKDEKIGCEIMETINGWSPKTVAFADAVIGCPHEETKDYPEGETCPECLYWTDRDRWAELEKNLNSS